MRARFRPTLLFVLVAGCGGKLPPSSDAGPNDDLDDAAVPRPPVSPGVDGSSRPPTFPPPEFDGGRPPPIPPPPGFDGGPPPPGCPELVPEGWFSRLQLDGTPLGRPYAAWGVSDNDFYVAIGVETNSWPSTSSLAAVAHWNGAAWTLDRLPPINDISGMAGRSGSDLWILGMTQQSGPRKLLRNAGSNGWQETAISEYIVDIELVGTEEGFMSGSRTSNLIDGVLYRVRGDSWTAEPLPDIGQRYGFLKLEANDERQVYGQGYVVGGSMGSFALGAFDGSTWRTAIVPPECGSRLEGLAGATSGVFTLASSVAGQSAHRLCRVSSDLSSWIPLGEFSAQFQGRPSLAATRAGTLVVTSDSMGYATAPMLIARGQAMISCPTPLLYDSLKWVAPGSPLVHIFSASQFNPTGPGYHWTARVDP